MASSARPPNRRGPSGAWSRLKPVITDPLDAYGLPSKGEQRLHEYKAQESYYSKIVERYMKFCATASSEEGLEKAFSSLSVQDPPLLSGSNGDSAIRPVTSRHTPSSEHSSDLPNIHLAMRKLREGITASRRRDSFAQRAYIFIIHASVLTRSWESYQPALEYLLRQIHPHTPLSTPELQEFVGYHILDLACRQYELVEAFATRLKWKHRDRRIGFVLKSIVHDDWVRLWRTRRAVTGYQRAILDFAVERMRLHALKCLGRGYLNADKAFIERAADLAWDDLVKSGVAWQLQDNGSVIIRKPKAK